jgi:hypothetical protein
MKTTKSIATLTASRELCSTGATRNAECARQLPSPEDTLRQNRWGGKLKASLFEGDRLKLPRHEFYVRSNRGIQTEYGRSGGETPGGWIPALKDGRGYCPIAQKRCRCLTPALQSRSQARNDKWLGRSSSSAAHRGLASPRLASCSPDAPMRSGCCTESTTSWLRPFRPSSGITVRGRVKASMLIQ